ncbi:sterol desaturase [Culex quinquefasciatus]|uniref:Sterol desaturase n=1 Tax=Culex quinquefasciatus TaxID=7176 RepID=B0XDV7_CULQU|nr:sterol desaturase [Culex quinquefasciatus]|eukprot:XP_001867829.1 sterol desaturase [Culex quinquefasciatus]
MGQTDLALFSMSSGTKFNQCFGVLGVLDRVHGTDTLFRNTKAYARHIMMLSFMPAREAFPEPAKKAF